MGMRRNRRRVRRISMRRVLRSLWRKFKNCRVSSISS